MYLTSAPGEETLYGAMGDLNCDTSESEVTGAVLDRLRMAVEAGDQDAAVMTTRQLIDSGEHPRTIVDPMTVAMTEVGRRFQTGEIFVPEMLIAALAMKASMTLLEPLLVDAASRPLFTAVIGTISGDLHDIGKNLVAMMWKGANIEVVDLGVDVSPARFVDAAIEHKAHIVGVSALLTTTMAGMRDVVDAVQEAGLETKVVVGGAPTTPEFAASIGAAGHAANAAAAVDLILDHQAVA